MEDVKNEEFKDLKKDQNDLKINEENVENKTACKIINIYDSEDFELDSNEDGVKGRIRFFKNYLTKPEADELYTALVTDLKWQQNEIVNIFGEKLTEPRLTFWYGKQYKYSKVTCLENEDWHPKLEDLKTALDNDSQLSPDPGRNLNSVMCNYYRDNNDSIGWHADDETSFGRCPRIVSISLGDTRVFELCKEEEYRNRYGKPKFDKFAFSGCTLMYRFHLGNGSLLLMEGSVQDNWLHRVPKESEEIKGRINLTFRYMVNKEEQNQEMEHKKKSRKKRVFICQKFYNDERSNGGWYNKRINQYDSKRNHNDYDQRRHYAQRYYNNQANYYDQRRYNDQRNSYDHKFKNDNRTYQDPSGYTQSYNNNRGDSSKYPKNGVSCISNDNSDIQKYSDTMNHGLQTKEDSRSSNGDHDYERKKTIQSVSDREAKLDYQNFIEHYPLTKY